MTNSLQELAIYIHWPYCLSKCPYCDFNSHVAATIDHVAWRSAYQTELAYYAQVLPNRRITSIFFGGGTPSLMEAKTVDHILQTIRKFWPLSNSIEITLEANPTSVEAQKFHDFNQAGINRLSLGIQSLRDDDLKFLGRTHSADQAKRAIDLAATIFPRFSFDLIYARHHQTPDAWATELNEALKLAKDHLSLYQLTIEPNTQFYTLASRGEQLTAPDETAALMFEQTQHIMCEAGLPAYEISNHAKPGEESRHNKTYWNYNDYIGIGPGAHGRYTNAASRIATINHKSPEIWLKETGTEHNGLREHIEIDIPTAQREALMMGLRLTSGITYESWEKKFGSPLLDFTPLNKISRLTREGYLIQTKEALKASSSGLQRLNAVLNYLLN